MVEMRTARERLEDIVVWSGRALSHLDGLDEVAFSLDVKTQDAVMRCIEVVGEAAGRLMKLVPDHEERFPRMELRLAYAARNRISHGYFATDADLLWSVATTSIPRMKADAERALAEMGSDD